METTAKQMPFPIRILALTVALALVAACSRGPVASLPTGNTEAPVRVKTLTLEPRAWTPVIVGFGRFESAEKAVIAVDIPGVVDEIHVEPGQRVEAGDLLIELDAHKQQLKLEQTRAQLESMRARMEEQKEAFQRYRSLIHKQAVSEEQLGRAEASFKSAAADVQRALAAEALARQELAQTRIVSPVDGTITVRNIEPGETVAPGRQLVVIQVVDSMRMVTYVTEREVNLLRIGQRVEVKSPGVPGETYQARVELIGSVADPGTGNFSVKLAVGNRDGLLREGMSATVVLEGVVQSDMLLVPRRALVDRGAKRVVYRAVNGRAEEVEPVLGISGDGWLPAEAGMAAGDQLILEPLELILDGTPVAVTASAGTELG